LNSGVTTDRKSIIMAITEEGGVGPRMFQQLLLRVGPPEELLNASSADLDDIPRLSASGADRLLRSLENIDEFTEKLYDYAADDIHVSTFLDDDYPEDLRKINDPPPVIYFRGDLEAWSHEYVALVGTTKASQAGLRLAVDLARELVRRGYGIVSGLATGIDSAAHLGAIKEQGRNIAVLGCGLLNIYPAENKSLADLICKTGLLISEQQPHRNVSKSRLVLRNRMITAFARAVVVVQIGEQTQGELRAAGYAFNQAKPLFYGDPDNNLEFALVGDAPGTVIKDAGAVDEIIRYIA
jgi:DNA processing protein